MAINGLKLNMGYNQPTMDWYRIDLSKPWIEKFEP
jgi:hypothetical protein